MMLLLVMPGAGGPRLRHTISSMMILQVAKCACRPSPSHTIDSLMVLLLMHTPHFRGGACAPCLTHLLVTFTCLQAVGPSLAYRRSAAERSCARAALKRGQAFSSS